MKIHQGIDWLGTWRFRLPIEVDANGHQRYDKPVEVRVESKRLFDAQNRGESSKGETFTPQLVEVDRLGKVKDDLVPFQSAEPSENSQGAFSYD